MSLSSKTSNQRGEKIELVGSDCGAPRKRKSWRAWRRVSLERVGPEERGSAVGQNDNQGGLG